MTVTGPSSWTHSRTLPTCIQLLFGKYPFPKVLKYRCHFKYTNCPNIHIRILIYILRIAKDGIFDDRQEWSMKSFNYEVMQTTDENGMSETESEDFRFSIFDGSPSDDSPYAKYIEQGDYDGDHGQDLFSEDD